MYVALHHLQLFILTFIYVGFDGSQSKCNLASAASASLDRIFIFFFPANSWLAIFVMRINRALIICHDKSHVYARY